MMASCERLLAIQVGVSPRASNVAPEVETVLTEAVKKLLGK
jgi:hypothetical protein